MNSNKDNVPSPCIKNCCLNEHDICMGCFRSLEEITGWMAADEQARQHFLVNAKCRKQQNTISKNNNKFLP